MPIWRIATTPHTPLPSVMSVGSSAIVRTGRGRQGRRNGQRRLPGSGEDGLSTFHLILQLNSDFLDLFFGSIDLRPRAELDHADTLPGLEDVVGLGLAHDPPGDRAGDLLDEDVLDLDRVALVEGAALRVPRVHELPGAVVGGPDRPGHW